MRKLKILLVLFCVAVVAAVVAIRTPAVQRAFLLRHMRKHFSDVRVGRVSIGSNLAKIKNIAFSCGDVEFNVPDITATWSLREFIFSGELKLRDVAVDGLFMNYMPRNDGGVSLKNTPPNAMVRNLCERIKNSLLHAYAVTSVFKHPKLPVPITMERLTVHGVIGLNEYIVIGATLEGTDFGPLNTSILKIDAGVDIGPGMDCKLKLQVDGEIKIFQEQDGLLSDIAVDINCKIFNQSGNALRTLNATFSSEVADAENLYKFTLSDATEGTSICCAKARLDKNEQKLFVESDQKLEASLLEEFSWKSTLPNVSIASRLSGEFEFESWNGMLKCSSETTFPHEMVNDFMPSLKSNLTMTADFVLRMKSGVLSINSFEAICNDSKDSLKILLYAVDPIIVWDKFSGYLAEKNIFNAGRSLMKIVVEDFNVKFLFRDKSRMKFEALATGQFDVFAKNGAFFVKSYEDTAMLLRDCSVSKLSKKYFDGLEISCGVNLSVSDKICIDFNNVSVKNRSGEEIFDGTVGIAYANADAAYSINCYSVTQMDKLCQLPFFPHDVAVNSGVFSGNISYGRTPDTTEINCDVKFKELKINGSKIPMEGECVASFYNSPEKISSDVDVNLSGEKLTSVHYALDGDKDYPSKTDLQFSMRGDAISIPDLMRIEKLLLGFLGTYGNRMLSHIEFMLSGESEEYFYADRASKKQVARWSDIGGHVAIGIGKIFASDSLEIDNFECLCSIGEDKIDLKTIDFYVAGSPFSLNAKLEYATGKQKNPYSFSASGKFDMLDIGKICTALDPSTDAIVEGSGRMSLQLSSAGDDVIGAAESVQWNLSIDCVDGILRLKNLLNDRWKIAMETMIANSNVAAFRDENFSPMAALLEESERVKYNTIKARISRDKKLDIVINSLSVNGPSVIVEASGKATYSRQPDWRDYPISIDAKIELAGRLREIIGRLGLITDRQRNSEYVQGPKVIIRGTMRRPHFSDAATTMHFPFR